MLNDNARRALDDLFYFGTEYWGLELEEKPHREMCAIIQRSEDDPETPFAMLVVPRGTYKTSIARAAAVWKQLRQIFLFENVYHRIMLASAVLAHGEASLRVIEGQLRSNQKLIADFGKLWIPPGGNTQKSSHPDGILLAPRIRAGEIAAISEPSFWVGSQRRISTGFHADGAVVDDLNNKENTATDVQREKSKTYWKLIFPIIGKTDRVGRPCTVILNATPWHDDDVRGSILRQEREREAADAGYKSKWVVLHRPAIDENGEPFFPSKLGVAELESLREDMGATEFSANYLCDPVGENGFVHEDEIQWKSRETFPADLKYLRLLVDPSQHTKARSLGCYTAMMVAAYDRFSNLYFLDARGSRDWDTADTIDQLFEIESQYPNIPIMVEDKHMAHFDHAIRLEEAARASRLKNGDRHVHLRVQYVISEGETKYQKWQKLQPRFRNRRVFLAEEIAPKIKVEIREELVRGTASRFKDFLDAMAMAELGVRPKVERGAPPVEIRREPGKPPAITFSNAVPGLSKYFDAKK